MGPLAALLARFGPAAAAMARGGRSVPHGARVPPGLVGMLGTPQRIGQGDIVQDDDEGAGERATMALSSLTKATAGAAAALLVLPKATQAVSNRLLEAQRNLTQYNATIAAAFHRLEVGRIGRDIQHGRATAGTTKELADSQDRLEEAMLPLQNLWVNARNTIADVGNEIAIKLVKGFSDAMKLKDVNEALFKVEPPNAFSLQQMLDNRRHEWLDEQKRLREPVLDLNRPNVD